MKHEMEIGTWMIQLKKHLKQQNLKNHSTRPLNDIKRLAPNHRYIHHCKNINCKSNK